MQTLDSIQSYEAYIQLQPLPGKRRIASTNTRRAYIRDLTLFARWFHDSIERPFTPANITREDIQDYIAHLRTVQDAAVSTIQRKYARYPLLLRVGCCCWPGAVQRERRGLPAPSSH